LQKISLDPISRHKKNRPFCVPERGLDEGKTLRFIADEVGANVSTIS
jgi:hypothetical protein